MKVHTIATIAKELNVSKSTISRAINNSHDINPATRKRILDYINSINFEPNSIAQSLRRDSTKRIGVIVPSFTISFYSIALCGIESYANEHGYSLLSRPLKCT